MHDPIAIARALKELARLLEIKGDSLYKVRAFQQAAVTVEARADELPRRIADDTLAELDYIGPTTGRFIRELWERGQSDYLNQLRNDVPEGVVQLASIPGVGPRRTMTLFRTLNISTPEELLDACRAQRVRHLHGFGEKTEAKLADAAAAWLAKRSRLNVRTASPQLKLPIDVEPQPHG